MSLQVVVLFSTIRQLLVRQLATPQSTGDAAKMRNKFQLNCAFAIVVITAVSGCMSPWAPGRSASSSVSVVQDASPASHVGNLSTTGSAESLEPGTSNVPKTTEEAMAAVRVELQKIDAVDHVAHEKLVAELHQAKPEDWSGMVSQFQSALAFRDQLAAKESRGMIERSVEMSQVSSDSSDSIYAVKETVAHHDKEAFQPAAAMAAISPNQGFPQVASAMLADSTASRDALSEHLARMSAQTVVAVPKTPLDTRLAPLATATAMAGKRQVVEQADVEQADVEQVNVEQERHVASAVSMKTAGSSQEHLQAAITSLEQSTREVPTSVDDVQQQMRLRLLRLLAGQQNAAMSPIPGASSTQQDYWSNQLFAISTYLDNEQQPDVKRRAASSLMHLDSARANLADLATLNVRSLTFVDSVDGFGVYQEHEETKFRPGDQVTLYTEVENFQSRSTKEGFHTQLSTSYEVLDLHGARVDGAQFPDVEDLCKNQRRDFHMQYGVALPTHIYPGRYQLKLTITDQLSHKIGQTSVPFEIVEK